MDATARPPLRRHPDAGLVGGVCAGLGRHLGIDPIVFRVGFVAATFAGGTGIALYVLAWALIPTAPAPDGAAPRVATGAWQTAAGVGCLVLAALLAFRELGLWVGDAVAWPVVLAASGAALVWRHSTMRPPGPVPARTPRAGPQPDEPPRAGGARSYRGGFGVALIVGAGLLFLEANGALEGAQDVVVTALVVIVGSALILAPFWWRLVRGLAAEREERVRSQERAEVAAHLHDSVLQTLALIQRRASDPRAVAALARRQERELRTWLSGGAAARPDERLSDALRAAADDVEQAFGVPVDVVTVGDRGLDARGEALVAAAREAMVNAAKFAGESGPVVVYAETEDGRTQVFVRDRGPGFDPDAVPEDRRGLRESIMGRMTRHGGQVRLHFGPESGTEVELVLEDQR